MAASIDRAALGRDAEKQALAFLQRQGLSLLERNYRCRQGELDLVMRERDTTVFVEVRFRGAGAFSDGAASVDAGKQRRLVLAAQHYLQRHPQAAGAPCRFDVISIGPNGGKNHVEWIPNAIELSESF